ncbi:AMP-dependent synthetase/ligase [Fulvivirga kasyanovii]|uniref:AMP-dependent synthetase/ligase domain-containing protein n=1 Tax=Fulvivirga kasyanovii TaxID=396812 RepID=A0ABW9RNW9_9BACT|nr:AMP-binding protein [Fulvivirga kasyanovii]MTI25708.1 hypothetical protein [Fulvivirga kasyanovii]
MNLNNLLNKIKSSEENRLEYYEGGTKRIKRFKEVYVDVVKVVNLFTDFGLQRGERIGILGTNSYEWIIIDLACVIKGLVTIPFETTKKNDVAQLISEFNLSYFFTNIKEHYRKHDNGKVLTFSYIIEQANDSRPIDSEPYDDNDVFTIVSTSGTSGKSKFVEVRKLSFDHLGTKTNELFNFEKEDRFLVFLPLSIYLERCYIYSAILLGFNVILTPFEYIFYSIQNDRPSVIIGIPYFFENFQRVFLEKVNERWLNKAVFRSYLFLKRINLGFLFKNKFAPFIKAWGGNIRFLLTGAAPIRKDTLHFFNDLGITLYEGYGLTEIGGMVALNAPGRVKVGSVGKPFPDKDVFTDEDGQIIVKSNFLANSKYLISTEEENTKTYLPDGSVATGDLGYFDDDGYLFVHGRLKDLIVTSTGKKVHPTYIEEVLINSGFFKNCLVYGEKRPYLVAILIPKDNSLEKGELKKIINEINERLSDEQKIIDFLPIDETFTIENKMLTNTLKINRPKILEKYKEEIENLYN